MLENALASIPRDQSVRIQLRSGRGKDDGVEVSGPRGELENCRPRIVRALDSLVEQFKTETKDLEDGVVMDFVRSSRGRIGQIAKQNEVLFKLRSDSQPSVTGASAPEQASNQAEGSIMSIKTKRSIKVLCVTCDFKKTKTEVVVNAANGHFRHGGGIAFHIAEAAGPTLKNECDQAIERHGGPLSIGDAVRTTSGDLSRHGIISIVHAVVPDTSHPDKRDLMDLAVYNSLMEAESGNNGSIAITLMGSGIYGWPDQLAAETIVSAIRGWTCRASPVGSLERIVLFDSNPSKVAAFIDALEAATFMPALDSLSAIADDDERKPFPRPTHAWYWNNGVVERDAMDGRGPWVQYDYDQAMQLESALGKTSTVHIIGDKGGMYPDTRHKVDGLPLYSVNLDEMLQTNAKSGFRRRIDRKPITSDSMLPPMFLERQQQFNEDIEGRPSPRLDANLLADTRVTVKRTASGASSDIGNGSMATLEYGVSFTGLARNVTGAIQDLDRFLMESYVETEGIGILYPITVTAAEIEKEVESVKLEGKGTLIFTGQKRVRVRALGSANCHKIETAIRQFIEEKMISEDLPSVWANTDPEKVVLTDIKKDTEEWFKVQARFSRGFACEILKVERIEAPRLYRKYLSQRRHVMDENGGSSNLLWLVHGTSGTAPKQVIESAQGLSPQYCDRGYFGRAVYMAEDMAYSHSYKHTLADGTFQALLVELEAGKVNDLGSNLDGSLRAPSPGYHTVKGQVATNHQAYMVYEHHRQYPTHLITYKKP